MPHPVLRDAKAELVRAGVPQKTVAERFGRSQQYVGDILNGRRPAPPELRRIIAELVGVPERELFS